MNLVLEPDIWVGHGPEIGRTVKGYDVRNLPQGEVAALRTPATGEGWQVYRTNPFFNGYLKTVYPSPHGALVALSNQLHGRQPCGKPACGGTMRFRWWLDTDAGVGMAPGGTFPAPRPMKPGWKCEKCGFAEMA